MWCWIKSSFVDLDGWENGWFWFGWNEFLRGDYLGDTDPQQSLNELDMLFSMSQWGQNDRKGKAGDIYVYVNYYETVEFKEFF